MKKIFQYQVLLLVAIAFASCKKDNYDAPKSTLSGKLVYQGEAIGVEFDRVPFQLYQFGFGKVGSIDGTFAPDGTYSALLFDGDYKLIIPNGQGPFKWKQTAAGDPDSLSVSMRGDQTLDLEVTPYYMIRTPQITGSAGIVTGTFNAQKIITDASGKDIERVSLYLNKTQFVSGANNVAVTDLGGGDITDPAAISLNVTVPTLTPTQNYVYARIGVKVVDVEDMLYSPVVKIQL